MKVQLTLDAVVLQIIDAPPPNEALRLRAPAIGTHLAHLVLGEVVGRCAPELLLPETGPLALLPCSHVVQLLLHRIGQVEVQHSVE